MKVIDWKYLPTQPVPLQFTVLTWLVLDRLAAPGWAWGVMGTIVVAGWVGRLYTFFKQETTHPSKV